MSETRELVERIQGNARELRHQGRDGTAELLDDCATALLKAEEERHMAEGYIVNDRDVWRERTEQSEAEIERLRGALEEIATSMPPCDLDPMEAWMRHDLAIHDIAKEALTPQAREGEV